jgi:ribosomal protein L11 methyltransferase
VRRVSFRLPAEEKEDLLDALMPLLPAGISERPAEDGEIELTTVAASPPERAVMEAAAGRRLAGWREEDVPADWRGRRARFGGGAFLVAGRVRVRSPWDQPAGGDFVDLVLERGGGGFGSGTHATTRMCLALLVDLEPAGGAADLGCGLGTLAIAAARLGWSPVVAVDRMEGAVAAARANGVRNGVDVDWRVADLETEPIPMAELLLVNAPPPVHARAAAALAAAADPRVGTGRAGAASSSGGGSSGAGSSGAGSSGAGSSGAGSSGAGSSGAASSGAASSGAPSSGTAASRARRVIVSGLVPDELGSAAREYAAAGWVVAVSLEEDGWAAALLEPAGA